MRRWLPFLFLFLFGALLTGALRAGAPEDALPEREIVDLSGSEKTVGAWARTLAGGDMPLHWRRHGDLDGELKRLEEGAGFLLAACLSPEELDALPESLEAIPVALAAGAVWVNLDNPLRSVTLEQAQLAMSGGYADWSELGLGPYQFHRIGLEPRTRGAETLRRRLLGDMQYAPVLFRVRTSAEVEILVGGAEYGIGCGWFTPASQQKIRALAIDGVEPDPATIADGTYPLSFRIAMVFNRDGEAAEFWRQAASALQEALRGTGWVTPLSQDYWLPCPESPTGQERTSEQSEAE